MNYYIRMWRKYAEFSGRASRKEYWMAFLFNALVTVGLMMIDAVIGTFSAESGMGLLSGLYALVALCPGLAICVRRLHDTGRRGWWVLLALVPFVGIFLLIFMLIDGEPRENKFGPDPKMAVA